MVLSLIPWHWWNVGIINTFNSQLLGVKKTKTEILTTASGISRKSQWYGDTGYCTIFVYVTNSNTQKIKNVKVTKLFQVIKWSWHWVLFMAKRNCSKEVTAMLFNGNMEAAVHLSYEVITLLLSTQTFDFKKLFLDDNKQSKKSNSRKTKQIQNSQMHIKPSTCKFNFFLVKFEVSNNHYSNVNLRQVSMSTLP